MRKHCIAIVAGTRPEIIKLAPVYHALRENPRAQVRWVHTGQHGEMASAMLQRFGIVPEIDLPRRGSSIEEFSVGCRAQLDAARAREQWDVCVVQGDTESAFLGALAAYYGRVPVAHVEAGLRTNNLASPFPEEGIRQMISRLACVHFAPTQGARVSLLREGISSRKIIVTGNTVVDAQHWICRAHGIHLRASPHDGDILVTAHRREHWGEDMAETFQAVADIARAHPQRRVVFPVHLNPVVQRPAHAILGGIPNILLLPPLDYVEMQRALANAALLLTDSGGLQEEAPTFGVPTLVLRRETERPEAVQAGCALLVGPGRQQIVEAASRLIREPAAADAMRKVANPFGDGRAAHRIMEVLLRVAAGESPVPAIALPLLPALARPLAPRRIESTPAPAHVRAHRNWPFRASPSHVAPAALPEGGLA